jgi:hypothetical protein
MMDNEAHLNELFVHIRNCLEIIQGIIREDLSSDNWRVIQIQILELFDKIVSTEEEILKLNVSSNSKKRLIVNSIAQLKDYFEQQLIIFNLFKVLWPFPDYSINLDEHRKKFGLISRNSSKNLPSIPTRRRLVESTLAELEVDIELLNITLQEICEKQSIQDISELKKQIKTKIDLLNGNREVIEEGSDIWLHEICIQKRYLEIVKIVRTNLNKGILFQSLLEHKIFTFKLI